MKQRTCPKCGNPITNYYAKQCRACYLKSDEFHAQLARQSKVANIRANQVRWGYKANDWVFAESSPELAYIIGAYLTDGWIQHFAKSDKVAGFAISGVYPDFMAHVLHCLQSVGLPANYIKPRDRSKDGRQTQIRVLCSSQNFSRWLKAECEGKSCIPKFLHVTPIAHKMAFLAGAIDGDGCVGVEGGIAVYGTKQWMKDLPAFLATIPIRTFGYHVIKTLPSGKPFARVSVHRGDFVQHCGNLAVEMKQERILHPNRAPRKLYVCPQCGNQRMTKKQGNSCRDCWREGDEQKEHMRRISALGNAIKAHR